MYVYTQTDTDRHVIVSPAQIWKFTFSELRTWSISNPRDVAILFFGLPDTVNSTLEQMWLFIFLRCGCAPFPPDGHGNLFFPNFGHVQFPPQQTSNRPASSLFLKSGHVPTSTTTDVQILFFLGIGHVQFPLQQVWKFTFSEMGRDPCLSHRSRNSLFTESK